MQLISLIRREEGVPFNPSIKPIDKTRIINSQFAPWYLVLTRERWKWMGIFFLSSSSVRR